ncbi:TM2 domain-containing protein [Bacillus toyonensis]|uniref:TM2 domain-containing protein n=1 Tax=Bacillus toyonensis TaxID=155322 RepID=UPI00163B12B2|nr:TM2 domain-containing protein [Bacillus toyonensis]MBC2686457.1 TM2 domain-containing protein [Bacillus toyonensis]
MDNLLLKKDLTTDQMVLVTSEFEKKKKSKGLAYLIWFFLGGLGIWALIDVFFIGSRIGKKNEMLEREIIMKVKKMTASKRLSS